MPAKVVDASVLAALTFQEPRTQEALALLTGADLIAPMLLAYELTSVARKKCLLDARQQGAIQQALATTLQIDILWVEPDHSAVLQLALETGLTTFDATYLYLSRSLAAPLVTFDQQLGAFLPRGKT